MPEKSGFLDRLLQYELRASERYRRFLSVVMISSNDGLVRLREFLSGTMRNSDEYDELDESSATILMGDTDAEGALCAVERFKAQCGGEIDLRFGVATYPADGGEAEHLLNLARKRLQGAAKSEFGAVVLSDDDIPQETESK